MAKGFRGQNIAMVVIIALMSILLLGGSILYKSLDKGTDNMMMRLGADIMIVPKGAKEEAENFLIEGQRSAFYFDNEVYDKLKNADGISEISVQTYLRSLAADCCSSQVQIVFFDPETDFLVGPWLESTYSKSITGGEAIVGYNVGTDSNNAIRLFDREYSVVSKMAKTGTALDDSVYFPYIYKEEMISMAEEKGYILSEQQKDLDVISSVYINIKDGYKVSDIVGECHDLIGDDFDVIYPKQLDINMVDQLKNIQNILAALIMAMEVILLVILFVINTIHVKMRGKVVALMRFAGNSKLEVYLKILQNLCKNAIFGAIIGCFVGTLIIVPFGNYIGRVLSMPYLGPGSGEIILHIVLTVVIIVLVEVISASYPVFNICNMQPYLALRREAE